MLNFHRPTLTTIAFVLNTVSAVRSFYCQDLVEQKLQGDLLNMVIAAHGLAVLVAWYNGVKKFIEKKPPSAIDWSRLRSLPRAWMTAALKMLLARALLTPQPRRRRRRSSYSGPEFELPTDNTSAMTMTNVTPSQDNITSSVTLSTSVNFSPPPQEERQPRWRGQYRTTDY